MSTEETQATPLFRNRNFVKSFFAFGLSSFGDWFDMIAMITLFTYIWAADPFTVSLVPLMYALPSIFLGPVAGVYVDRWNKVQVMMWSDVFRGVVTLGLIFAPSPLWALPLMFIRSLGSVFSAPAQQSLLRHLVPDGQLLRANSLNEMVFQASKVLGPLLGSVIVAAYSPQVCLAINTGSFLLSALVLWSIRDFKEQRATSDPAVPAKKGSFRASLREGWQILVSSRLLMTSTIFFLCCLFALQMIDAQVGILMREYAPDRSELIGWTLSAIGVGTLLMGAILSRQQSITAYGWVLGGGAVLIGFTFWGLGMMDTIPHTLWTLGVALCGGFGVGLAFIGYNYLRQRETPKEALGRVTGILNSLTSSVVVIAPLIGSALTNGFGVAASFKGIGLAIIILGLFGIVLQRLIWKPAM